MIDKNKRLNKYINFFDKNNNGEFILLGDEIKKDKIKIKHLVCGNEYYYNIYNLKNKIVCPNRICAAKKIKQTCLEKYGVENPSQLQEVKDKKEKNISNSSFKFKQTCLEKYGVENPSQLQEVKDKKEKIFQEKYGVKSPIIINRPKTNNRKKSKKTCLEKYGVENPSQLQEVKDKKEKTCLEKYNKKHYTETNEFKNKIKNKYLDKYYNKISNLENVFPLFEKNEFKGIFGYTRYKWKCKKCNNIFFDYLHSHIPRCPACNPFLNKTSFPEQEIQNYLNISQKNKNKRFYKNNKYIYELDIYISEKNIGIELNGIYWHSELNGKDKNYHINKTKYFESLNIQLLHFWDIEWINKQNIVKSIISNKLNLTENKIFARKCIIKIVNNQESKNFLNNNHLQGSINSSINLGLYYNNQLVSLLNICKSRFNKNYQYEIHRYCNKLNTSIIGGFSKLFKYFINKYNPLSIITYADRRYSNGGLYKNNGFILSHMSNPNYFYTKNYTFLESRNKYQKHKLSNLLENFDNELTEWENMQLNGYDRIWDCGNYVFIWRK